MELMCAGPYKTHFVPHTEEALAMACCPKPYEACKKEERVEGCDEAISSFIGVSGSTLSRKDAYTLIQKARGALQQKHKSCHVLSPELPHAKCATSEGEGAAF